VRRKIGLKFTKFTLENLTTVFISENRYVKSYYGQVTGNLMRPTPTPLQVETSAMTTTTLNIS